MQVLVHVPEIENWQNLWNFPRHMSHSNFTFHSQTHILSHLTAMEIFSKQNYFHILMLLFAEKAFHLK